MHPEALSAKMLPPAEKCVAGNNIKFVENEDEGDRDFKDEPELAMRILFPVVRCRPSLPLIALEDVGSATGSCFSTNDHHRCRCYDPQQPPRQHHEPHESSHTKFTSNHDLAGVASRNNNRAVISSAICRRLFPFHFIPVGGSKQKRTRRRGGGTTSTILPKEVQQANTFVNQQQHDQLDEDKKDENQQYPRRFPLQNVFRPRGRKRDAPPDMIACFVLPDLQRDSTQSCSTGGSWDETSKTGEEREEEKHQNDLERRHSNFRGTRKQPPPVLPPLKEVVMSASLVPENDDKECEAEVSSWAASVSEPIVIFSEHVVVWSPPILEEKRTPLWSNKRNDYYIRCAGHDRYENEDEDGGRYDQEVLGDDGVLARRANMTCTVMRSGKVEDVVVPTTVLVGLSHRTQGKDPRHHAVFDSSVFLEDGDDDDISCLTVEEEEDQHWGVSDHERSLRQFYERGRNKTTVALDHKNDYEELPIYIRGASNKQVVDDTISEVSDDAPPIIVAASEKNAAATRKTTKNTSKEDFMNCSMLNDTLTLQRIDVALMDGEFNDDETRSSCENYGVDAWSIPPCVEEPSTTNSIWDQAEQSFCSYDLHDVNENSSSRSNGPVSI